MAMMAATSPVMAGMVIYPMLFFNAYLIMNRPTLSKEPQVIPPDFTLLRNRHPRQQYDNLGKEFIWRSMASWKVTATTIYCDTVDDEVTVLVYKDFSIKCTGYTKYFKPTKEIDSLLKKKGKQLGHQLLCQGLECPRVIQYREKLSREETKKESKANR